MVVFFFVYYFDHVKNEMWNSRSIFLHWHKYQFDRKNRNIFVWLNTSTILKKNVYKKTYCLF